MTVKQQICLEPVEGHNRGSIGQSDDEEAYGVCRRNVSGVEDDEYSYSSEEEADEILSALVLDGEVLQRFFRTCARARATQRHTQLKWVEYKESAVLNAVYTVFFWKGAPGIAEIDFGVQAEIDKDTEQYTAQNERAFLARAVEGGQATVKVLKNMEENRQSCIGFVQELLRDQGKINSGAIRMAQQGLNRLATIKVGSDIIIAVGAPFVVDLGYSLITATIDEVSKGQDVDAVLITGAKEGSKNVGQEIADHIGSAQARKIAEEIAKFEKEIEALNEQIARNKNMIKRVAAGQIKISRKNRAAKMAKKIANLNRKIAGKKRLITSLGADIYQKSAFKPKPNAKAVLGKSVKWLFVANSIKGAVGNFNKVYKSNP